MKTIGIYRYKDGVYEKVGNFPVRLNEERANIAHVKQVVSQESFKGEEVVIVDVDFLKIPDTSSTRGSLFWKNPNKKISAILEEDYSRTRSTFPKNVAGSKRFHPDEKQSLIFEERLRKVEKSLDVSQQKDKVLLLDSEVASLKLKLAKANDILQRVLTSFRCTLCMKCPVLPAYKSPCCEEVLGCYNCIQQWLDTQPSCPFCRASMTPESLVDIPVIKPLFDALSEIDESN
ncbi:PREDICTED: uncharacterized protein LOC109589173 [Amphimedon queenslandica]|nr:PREDICTED: uncharacterized protein LOC109589173 [Amphimedon queenslandica]|eukprot:XP_019860855.1 PREDICTED: uncharacterized protein LOC109589173 [Amphimedon queenslandica]